MDQAGMKKQLLQVKLLLRYLDPEMHNYLGMAMEMFCFTAIVNTGPHILRLQWYLEIETTHGTYNMALIVRWSLLLNRLSNMKYSLVLLEKLIFILR